MMQAFLITDGVADFNRVPRQAIDYVNSTCGASATADEGAGGPAV